MNNIKPICNLVTNSISKFWIDNTIAVFKSINNIYYLIYSTKIMDIVSYNIINNKKINEIKNAHKKFITNLRHYLDKLNSRDLILTISSQDYNLKIWDNKNLECLIDIENIYKNGFLHSSYLLNENNKIYIITSNCYWRELNTSEPIKVFDFKGNKIKEIKNSNNITFLVDIYYDNKLSNNYIIAGCNQFIKVYDFTKNELYHEYYDKDSNDHRNNQHYSIIIIKEELVKLIESSCDGNIRIWDFHSALLLKKIFINKEWLKGICHFRNDYLFVGSIEKKIRLIDLKKGKVVYEYKNNDDMALTIKKIVHPKYGECLISHGNDKIKLWKINIFSVTNK